MAMALVAATAVAVLAVAPAARADSADENYSTYCERCHGERGRGDGPSVPTLTTRPQSFANCAQMKKIPDGTIFNAIKNGGAFVGLPTDMPSWNNDLSDDEIHDLVRFVRAFCKK